MANNALGLMMDGLGVEVGHFQTLLARLDLFSEGIVLTRYDEGQERSCFEVGPDELAAAFAGLPIGTGLLPRECLFFERRGSDECIGIFVPAEQWTLATEDGVFDVPLPPLIWVGCGREYRIYAVKQRPGEREGLFCAPLPNVYHGGKVCQGDVRFPVCSARTIREALALFFGSVFNQHLSANRSKKHHLNVLTLWDELDGESDFPLDDLRRTGETLADLTGGGR